MTSQWRAGTCEQHDDRSSATQLDCVYTIKKAVRRRQPKTGTKRSQTGGRAAACSSWGTLTQNCISPAGVAMGMSSNVVNTPVSVMGTSWQLAISSRNMLTCSLALLNWCLRETGVVARVWRGFGRPLSPLIRHLVRWPTGAGPGHCGNGYYKRYYSQGAAKEAAWLAEVKVELKRFGLLVP